MKEKCNEYTRIYTQNRRFEADSRLHEECFPHSHLECLKTLENRLYKLSPVRASEVVEYLERENFGLHAKNDNLERKLQYKLDHYTDDNKVLNK